MCLAVPGKIIKIDGRKATVEYPDGQRFALIGDEKVKIGDYILVQMGIIIQALSAKEANTSLKAWKVSF
jgi:hydrogenase expression/formation protein HypC